MFKSGEVLGGFGEVLGGFWEVFGRFWSLCPSNLNHKTDSTFSVQIWGGFGRFWGGFGRFLGSFWEVLVTMSFKFEP